MQPRLQSRFGAWNSCLLVGAIYLILMAAVGLALPAIDEVPGQFPPAVLWQSRIASLGAQLILWATLGGVFGALTERATARQDVFRARAV